MRIVEYLVHLSRRAQARRICGEFALCVVREGRRALEMPSAQIKEKRLAFVFLFFLGVRIFSSLSLSE
jgi:hypothetical protein